jgi:hypothetical protein
MCKTTLDRFARHFFFRFTLQVIVILELCSIQPHEALGIDLGARRNSGANRVLRRQQKSDTRHPPRNANPRIKRS